MPLMTRIIEARATHNRIARMLKVGLNKSAFSIPLYFKSCFPHIKMLHCLYGTLHFKINFLIKEWDGGIISQM